MGVDILGCAWIAESGRSKIARWCPPYFPLDISTYHDQELMMTDKKVFKLGRRGVFLAFLATLLCTVAGLWSLIPLAQSISADSTWDADSVSASHLATGPTTTQTVFLPHVVRGTNVARTSVFGLQLYNDLTAPSAALSLAQQASVNWVRWPIWWYSVEPVNTTPEYYRFDYWDRSIRRD